ncbi:hydroxysteroid dehydrogenase-like protein 1 [Trichonephila clavipes]|nr:hydroxysteroid dehydrogenase-like protein 1 [Trichonephila clavipes]
MAVVAKWLWSPTRDRRVMSSSPSAAENLSCRASFQRADQKAKQGAKFSQLEVPLKPQKSIVTIYTDKCTASAQNTESYGKPWETIATGGPIPRHLEKAEAIARFRITSALSKLDIVQNKALRFIIGAATSTSIASKQLQTEISGSSERRLNTLRFLLRLSIVFGVSDNRLPLFKPTTFPGHLRYAFANLDLVLPVHKHNSLLAELGSVDLATIHERYLVKIGYTYLLMALPQLPFVGLELVLSSTLLILKNLLVPDSHAAIMTVSGYNLFPSKLVSSSANNLSTKIIAPEERSFSNGSHIIAAFMEMNKPTSWPKRLRRCIHFAFRCLFETPSDFSGTNFDRTEFPPLQTWLLANLGLVCSTAIDVLSFLPYLGWRVWHVSESSPDMITCKPICLRLAWLTHRSALFVNPG